MQELTALLGIATAIAIGAASPGPSFIMVARVAVASSRPDAVFAALGMGIGGLAFACLSLVGLNSLLLAVPSLYLVLKVAGGLYLAYLGIRIWRGAREKLATGSLDQRESVRSRTRAFVLALTTQVSNPKAAIIYASVFAAFLPPTPSIAFNVSVAGVVFLIEIGWYTLVALVLSSERPRLTYLRFKTWIDRAAGSMMIALGVRLATAARF
jgi:threonine/homoserine/homoserine lactone efflux protein